MAVGGFYRDLAGGALGSAQAQMQIEQMKLQRQQMEQQAAAQRGAQDIARQQVLADILGNTAKGVVGGIGAAQDYQTQQKRLGLEQQNAERQGKLAEAQLQNAALEREQALTKQVQEQAHLRVLGQLGLSDAQPSPAEPVPAVAPAAEPSPLNGLVQPAAAPGLGMAGARNAANARQSMADMVGVSPVPVQAPVTPAAPAPQAAQAPVQLAKTPDAIAEEIYQGLSEEQRKAVGDKNVLKGMVVAEQEQRKAVQMQQKRLELGLIKDQADADMAKRQIAHEVITNTIKQSSDPATIVGLLNNPVVAASGISRAEIEGMAKDYAAAKDKDKASTQLETKVREAQIRASNASAAENSAQAQMARKQAANYESDVAARKAAAEAASAQNTAQRNFDNLTGQKAALESQHRDMTGTVDVEKLKKNPAYQQVMANLAALAAQVGLEPAIFALDGAVKMKFPDGVIRDVPQAEVEDAKANGKGVVVP